MRVAIVTGTEAHHKSLCGVIAKSFDVVGIIHPATVPNGFVRGTRFIRAARRYGWSLGLLHLIGMALPANVRGGDGGASSCAESFSNGMADYDRIPRSLIHHACDMRHPHSAALLRSLSADVVVCLGGPFYPSAFIEAAPLVLNYHSGISPLYNGTGSIAFAFANGHPHLCGGTLMRMSTAVDGGEVLAHYLPAIEAGDTPTSLFQKTVAGATLVYNRILNAAASKRVELRCVPQPPALFSTRAIQFGWYQTATIAQNLRNDIAARFQRNESLLEYWSQPDEESANAAFQSALNGLLWQVQPEGSAPWR